MNKTSENTMRRRAIPIAAAGVCAVMLILILGTVWMGRSARRDTEEAVSTVSRLYLDELAGRREQVIEANLRERIHDVQAALDLLTEEDLSDRDRMEAYEARMKKLFTLDKFAFVDAKGLIYTSTGTQDNIDEYRFDYRNIDGPEISVKNPETPEKKVIIAVPADRTAYNGEKLVVCFMEIDMQDMLAGVSIQSRKEDTTFSNLYTSEGVALSNTILGGLAVEDNLLDALAQAEYDKGYSLGKVLADFKNLTGGEASFTYKGIHETLAYAPVEGTDWMLTYLIRESVISEKIGYISEGAVRRSVIQSLVTIAVMLGIFGFFLSQYRKNAQLLLEKETLDAENRVKQEELDYRAAMQKKLEDRSRALDDALAAAEDASRAKTSFLSSMSHEIRIPMNAIIGLDTIALQDPDLPETTRGYLEKIGTSAGHLLDLINDILDMSRIESGRLTLRSEEFSFRDLLEAVNTMFSGQCAEKGLEYHCHIEGQIDDYYIGDDTKLRQVLINILGNAVKFTPEGGRIDFQVWRKAAYGGQTTLEFRIEDTGVGISEDFLPHIFDTFVQEDDSMTNRYGSSGLGLAITKNLVKMMNGTIGVESEKGKGSIFTVTVTLVDSARRAEEEAPGESSSSAGSALTGRRILVAEDVLINAEIMTMVLQARRMEADLADNGRIAVEKFRDHPPGYYAAVLMDMRMPEMDGLEAARLIRAMDREDAKKIPIIALTANAFDEDVQRSMQAGLNAHLSKPVQPEVLYETLESLIGEDPV